MCYTQEKPNYLIVKFSNLGKITDCNPLVDNIKFLWYNGISNTYLVR